MTVTQILGLTAGAAALLVAGTFALPRHIEITRSALVPAAPEAVLALAASSEGYQSFNPYLSKDPALKISPFGPSTGVGAGFHFDGKDGKGSQTVADMTADTVHFNIDLGPMGQPRQSITARPSESGSEVIWRMKADLGMNPIARVFGLFMDRMIGKTFETGLANLQKAA
ncbi:SRPBCC family protein [Primorskyibacter sp. S187A]|uniref:SRPBCC family protein n=1 Tax=Primorskyibacter sp. S187A TaxID=3415130 RepID=UPI003C7A0174